MRKLRRATAKSGNGITPTGTPPFFGCSNRKTRMTNDSIARMRDPFSFSIFADLFLSKVLQAINSSTK